MGAYHARLGPSSAKRWRTCTASPSASDGMPNEGSDASRDGTACHGVVAECLERSIDPVEFLWRKFEFWVTPFGDRWEDFAETIAEKYGDKKLKVLRHTVTITDEMVNFCDAYVRFVREQVALTGGTLLVEQRVPIGHITGEEGASGTSDVILMTEDTLVVIDAKFGRQKVVAYEVLHPARPDPFTGEMHAPVYAPNDQLAMYAGGALHEHGMFADFKTVKMVIVQPPLDHVSEFSMPVADLEAFLEDVKRDAEATRTNPKFVAGNWCTFCPARINCKARDAAVVSTALEGFGDVTDAAQIEHARPRQCDGNLLGVLYGKLSMIQEWCGDIASRVYQELQAGRPVIGADGIGYKLVAGKKGARQWADAETAEVTLKKMRLRDDEMYEFKLLSPTAAEKLATPPKVKKGEAPKAPVLGERQWTKLHKMIVQADPKPTVAPETDPRPAIAPAVSGFEDQSSPPAAAEPVDLFN